MKSYKEHLKSFLNSSPTHSCKRASAVFPIFFSGQIKTKLCFVNYWKLKRNIEDLLCELFLRNASGNLISKKSFLIDEIKSYQIDLFDLLGIPYPFLGSIEIQFSSKENLVFPYPGVVVIYEGKNFCSFVHSAQRIYTEEESSQNTQRSSIIESGFNIYADQNKHPFITLINGALLTDQAIELVAINKEQEEIKKSIQLSCCPYQTLYLDLIDWKELPLHLNGSAGCLKIKLFNTQSFPRLIVGNHDKQDQSLSVTHTYYDLSQSKREVDYWEHSDSKWHPMTLMLPLKENNIYFTNIYFYPIYSPTIFWVDAEIYDAKGILIRKIEKIKKISSQRSFQCLNFSEHLKDNESQNELSVRLIAYPEKGQKIPARIKIGFDMGFKNKGLPCNICTNFSPSNPSLEQKPHAFRWAPMMPSKINGTIWCFNDCPKKNYTQSASIECQFYRSKDQEKLSMKYVIPPHGHLILKHTKETKEFFEEEIGWCIITSDNPYISTYYFSEHSHQMIGADHGF